MGAGASRRDASLGWDKCWHLPRGKGNDLVQNASICWQVLKGLTKAITVMIANVYSSHLVQACPRCLVVREIARIQTQAVWTWSLVSNSSVTLQEPPVGWRGSHRGRRGSVSTSEEEGTRHGAGHDDALILPSERRNHRSQTQASLRKTGEGPNVHLFFSL